MNYAKDRKFVCTVYYFRFSENLLEQIEQRFFLQLDLFYSLIFFIYFNVNISFGGTVLSQKNYFLIHSIATLLCKVCLKWLLEFGSIELYFSLIF